MSSLPGKKNFIYFSVYNNAVRKRCIRNMINIFIICVYTEWRARILFAIEVLAFFTSLYLDLLWTTQFFNESEGGRNVNLTIYIQLEPVTSRIQGFYLNAPYTL
jgi:type IV secretory pathway TraG/TraD family ATPase VirD4